MDTESKKKDYGLLHSTLFQMRMLSTAHPLSTDLTHSTFHTVLIWYVQYVGGFGYLDNIWAVKNIWFTQRAQIQKFPYFLWVYFLF